MSRSTRRISCAIRRLSDEENERLFGKCANLHGHNYVLEVVVAGQIDPGHGVCLGPQAALGCHLRRVIQDVDHRNLNTDVPWLEGRIPTAENLALAFWERLRSELPEGIAALGSAVGDRQELG